MLSASLCVVFIAALCKTTPLEISIGTGLEEVMIRLCSFWPSANLRLTILTMSISCTLLAVTSNTTCGGRGVSRVTGGACLHVCLLLMF